jgi:hypothetical protein
VSGVKERRASGHEVATGMHARISGLLVLLAWSPSASVAAQAGGPRYHLLAQVEQSYSSNLFHEQTRRLPLFETLTGPRERYRGMLGPSDFVTEPGLEAGVRFKLGKRRSLAFDLGAQYALHARNAVANYLLLAAGARYKLGKRDSLSYQAGLVPERFVKNYPFDGLPSLHQTWFQRADRLELDNELSYRHAWTKRVRSELGLALNLNRFDAPFENRDTNEYAATVSSSYAPSRLLELELGFDFGLTRTPDGLEYRDLKGRRSFIPIDRSHHDVEPHLRVAFDLPARFGAVLGFGARLRQFETDERRDDTYYDRHDLRWKLDAELSKGFGKRFALTLQAGYQDNNAYRADPGDDADDYGYEELTLALGVSLLLD